MSLRPKGFERYRIQAKANLRVSDRDAIQVEAFVARFYDENDRGPTPHEFVEAARPKESELHHQLTWDADKALLAHQLHEARFRLRCYEYIPINPETGEEGEPLPGNVSFPLSFILQQPGGSAEPAPDRGTEREAYTPMFQILDEERLQDRYLQELNSNLFRARRELVRFQDACNRRSEGYQLVLEGINQIERDMAREPATVT